MNARNSKLVPSFSFDAASSSSDDVTTPESLPLPAAGQRKPGLKHRVLVVENDVTLLRSIAASLHHAGLEWEGAADGELGLQAFRENVPDLVLLSAVLPDRTGLEVCQMIRQQSRVPVIVLTESCPSVDQIRYFRMGADDCVLKPIISDLLAARVIAHLRRVYQYNVHAPQGNWAGITRQAEPQGAGNPSALPQFTGRQSSGHAPLPVSATRAGRVPQVPAGWAACSACNYMGPRQRFPNRLNESHLRVLLCPHCGVEGAVKCA